jgi:HD-GYP domain-containing protein (c-di-GMP phosphodiesterase class II)
MNLSDADVAIICRGALLHDIGKIGVPDAILNKSGLLDDEERRIMERHPLAGYEMLIGIPYLQDEIPIVLAHQEHWDGGGYPFGLKGNEIPLGARLFAIADTFDALTSDRPYRLGRSCDEALLVIAEEAGRQFDPQAVAAFLAVPPAEWLAIRSQVFAEVDRRRARLDERTRLSRAQRVNSGPQADATTPEHVEHSWLDGL